MGNCSKFKMNTHDGEREPNELDNLRVDEELTTKVADDSKVNNVIEEAKQSNNVCSRITMEPAFAAAVTALCLGQTSVQNLYILTACLDLGHGEDICYNRRLRDEYPEIEIESQRLVTQMNISRGFVCAMISACVLIFVGPWSDCSGTRRPLLLMSLLGMCFMSFNILMILTFPGYPILWVLFAVLLPNSFGGGIGLLTAAGFSYIGDVCNATKKNVTLVMGSNRAVLQCGAVLGSVLGPYLFKATGYYTIFLTVLALQTFAFVYVFMRVVDVNVNQNNHIRPFDIRLPYRALVCLFKQRDEYKRRNILLMVVAAMIDKIVNNADVLLLFFFLRNKFAFNDVLFGTYIAYKNSLSFLGTIFILKVLKMRLKLSDELIGFLSGISMAISTLVLLFAHNYTFIYLVPIVGLISQGSMVVQKPILNKQITTMEQGKIYSVVGGLEMVCQMIWTPLYLLLYTKTVSTIPGAWLYPTIGLALVQSICFLLARNRTKDPSNIEAKL